MKGGGSDEGRGSGRGGVHFTEESGRTGRRSGVAACLHPCGAHYWLGDGRKMKKGGGAGSVGSAC
jgi:hypothetical protein